MPAIIEDLEQLPLGSHCLSLHTSPAESVEHAADFLAGNPPGKAPSYWIGDASLAAYYHERIAAKAPDCIGCVHVLREEQVTPEEGRLRPIPVIREFIRSHPGGVSGGADTIGLYWTRETVPEHLEYEAWFQSQPRDGSRFICPYDLRRIPVREAPQILRELGAQHTHVALSASTEPAVRLLQLFLFDRRSELPEALAPVLAWGQLNHLVDLVGEEESLHLTSAGERVVEEWSRIASIDW